MKLAAPIASSACFRGPLRGVRDYRVLRLDGCSMRCRGLPGTHPTADPIRLSMASPRHEDHCSKKKDHTLAHTVDAHPSVPIT